MPGGVVRCGRDENTVAGYKSRSRAGVDRIAPQGPSLEAAAISGPHEQYGTRFEFGWLTDPTPHGKRSRAAPAFRRYSSRTRIGLKSIRPATRRLMDAEQTQVNLLVVRAFESLRIPYFLGGFMASSAHGIYRATADPDFVAAVRPPHAEP